MSYRFVLLMTSLAMAGCDQPTACTTELGIAFGPSDTTIAVTQQFRARLEFTSCGGRERWNGSPVWRSQDPDIATVDSSSGLVTGRSPGQTTILGHDPYEEVDGTVRVTVH